MIDPADFRDFALSLPETSAVQQGAITSFQLKKKSFATLHPPEHRATLRLSPENQDVFVAISRGAMWRVPNRWGYYGWTHLDLEKADWEMARDALLTAWYDGAPTALLRKYPDLTAE